MLCSPKHGERIGNQHGSSGDLDSARCRTGSTADHHQKNEEHPSGTGHLSEIGGVVTRGSGGDCLKEGETKEKTPGNPF